MKMVFDNLFNLNNKQTISLKDKNFSAADILRRWFKDGKDREKFFPSNVSKQESDAGKKRWNAEAEPYNENLKKRLLNAFLNRSLPADIETDGPYKDDKISATELNKWFDKKVRGGMIPAESGITSNDTQIRKNFLTHYGLNLKLLDSMKGKDVSEKDKSTDMRILGEQAYEKLSMLEKPISVERTALDIARIYGKSSGIFYDEITKFPYVYKYENMPH